MADKSVSIDLIIKSSEAASSLKDVKKSLKDIKDAMIGAGEGTPEFLKLAAAASELKAKVDDSNEAINAINPNKFQAIATFAAAAAGGISAVTGAMGLFGELNRRRSQRHLQGCRVQWH
jgi:L-serine deaminase